MRYEEREDRKTTTWVSVELDPDEHTTEQGQALVRQRLAGLSLPEGYSWDFGFKRAKRICIQQCSISR